MKRFAAILMAGLIGCGEAGTPKTYSNVNPPTAITTATHPCSVTTLDFQRHYSEKEVHEEIVKFIDTHPDERVISFSIMWHEDGAHGISFITTSTH